MKFQNPTIHRSKVNGRTHTQTDRQTDKPKAICPSNFFKVGGIKISILQGHVFVIPITKDNIQGAKMKSTHLSIDQVLLINIITVMDLQGKSIHRR